MALLWWKQEKILFQPPGLVDAGGGVAAKIDYTAADGQPLFGFLVGPVNTSDVLLCFHGNADLAAWQLEWATQVVERLGIAVFLAEYRGYGGISGKPTYSASVLDSEAAYIAVTKKLGAKPQSVVFFGHSLGSAIAAELSARHSTRALILQSPFTSVRDMAKRSLFRPVVFIWNLVSRVHFDVSAVVRNVDSRVSVIHGTRDMVIPHRMGEAVYRAAKVKGAYALVEKAGHNNVVDVAGEKYWEWLAAALRHPTAG